MLKRISLALAVGFALAGAGATGALAQGAPPPAQSGTYNVEPIHAMVMFGVSHFGFSNYYGQFPGATGTLTLDAANPAASHLDVSVPVANVWTPSDKLAEELKSSAWLDAAKYPTMTFKSTSITVTGPTTADVAGNMTIHGVTKPVVLKATFKRGAVFPMNKKYMIGFDATGHIKRSDFGISQYVNFGLGDDVDLTLSVPFEKAS
jgi:polyisoprenoid-binding protein YceI